MESSSERRKFYCEVLGVSELASLKLIKQAFHYLATQYHPDKNGGDEIAKFRFQQINEAYQYLNSHRFQKSKSSDDSADVYTPPQKLPTGWAKELVQATAVAVVAFLIGSIHHQEPAKITRAIASVEQPEGYLKAVLCQDPKLHSDISNLLASPPLPKPENMKFDNAVSEKDRNAFRALASELNRQFDDRMNKISNVAISIRQFCD